MKPQQTPGLLALAASLALTIAASAQQRPYIGFVYPAGGQQGTTFQVRLGGQALDGVNSVLVTGTGVAAKVTDYYWRLNNEELRLLSEQLRVLRRETMSESARAEMMDELNPIMMSELPGTRSAGTNEETSAASRKQGVRTLIDKIEQRTHEFVQTPACAAIASLVFVEVTIAPDAEPGEREMRLVTLRGVSNPLVFYVGQVPEKCRKPMVTATQQVLGKEAQALRKQLPGDDEERISMPCTVNGQIASGEVHRYHLEARQGQRLVITALGRRLIPFIADAVPGWFQPVLSIYDPNGKEVAYADDYRFKPDPTIFYQVPTDGEYMFTIRDSLYRGREDFVYRVTIGELPFITSVFPLGGQAGPLAESTSHSGSLSSLSGSVSLTPALSLGERENGRQSVSEGAESTNSVASKTKPQMTGWNLDGAESNPLAASAEPRIHWLAVKAKGLLSNRVPFALDTLPEALEQEPNNTVGTAQPVTLPVILNGQIEKPGDWDIFRFVGKSNDTVVAEVYARRLDSPLDALVKLMDSAGTVLAFNDDYEDLGAGINTHHADSYLIAKLLADGPYCVAIGDTARKGGDDYGYRLRLSAPEPDFDLRSAPSSLSLRSKSSASLTVYVRRKDGFTGAIKVALKDPPAGFSAPAITLSGTQTVTRLTIKTELGTTPEPVCLTVVGSARIGDREVVREIVPAEDRMQAFLWRQLAPAKELRVLVFDPNYQPSPQRVARERPPKPPMTNVPSPANGVTGTNTAIASSASATDKPKFTRQQVAGRLPQLKRLFQAGLLTDEFYEEKVAECEAIE